MTTSSGPVVIADQLHMSYPTKNRQEAPVEVLRGISLEVNAGEVVAIVGPSGSGKSTLLYCLAGLERTTMGYRRLLGHDLSTLSRGAAAKLRRDGVGFVFQSFNLIPSLSARENVALPARLAKSTIARTRVDDVLAHVGLSERASHLPGELSGGQQQRVAVARVLAMRPPVVFADEPTGSLDQQSGRMVLDLLSSVAAHGSAVVLVTHDLEAAARADRVIVLRDGAVAAELRRPSVADVFAAFTATSEVVR